MQSKQRGDTIVEVLVAILIVSLVLAGAFAATNRGSNLSQRTDERAYAANLLEWQTELIKREGGDPGSSIYDGAPFCIQNSTTPPAPGACTINGLYNVTARLDDPANNTFYIEVNWERLGNSDGTVTTEQAVNYLRVYPND